MADRGWLRGETKKWVKDGIINKTQANKIVSRYPQSGTEGHSKLVSVVSILGAILIGLGLFVFVASNWTAMPSFLKLTILYGTTFLAFFSGYRLAVDKSNLKFHYPMVGHAVIFLGSVMVGVTLALTAQIFNIEANFVRFFLIWFIAVAPLSYGFRTKPSLILSLFLFAMWLSAFMAGAGDVDDIFRGFFDGFGVFLFYGLTLYGIGFLHEKTPYSHFKGSYQAFGLFLTLLISFAVIVSEFEIFEEIGMHYLSYVFLLTAGAAVVASAFMLGKGVGKKQDLIWSLLAYLFVTVTWIISLNIEKIDNGLATAVLVGMNILFFTLICMTIFSGYYQKIPSFINIGLLFFVLYVGYIYFSTVFAYLPKSLALVVGGILLLAGGWHLEKKRKAVMQEIAN